MSPLPSPLPSEPRVDQLDAHVLTSHLEHGLTITNMRLAGERSLPLVRLRSGCHVGYGESPPLPSFTGLDAERTEAGLRAAADRVVGRTPREALAGLHAAPLLPGPVRCALDVALHDLMARAQGVPVDHLLGPRRRTTVRISRALGFHDPESLSALVAGYVARGVTAFKVKVGRDLASDLAAIETVRRDAGEACEIAIDANESLARADAVLLTRASRDLGIAYFEQPVARGDVDGLRAVREAGLPVMADESAFDAGDVERLALEHAIDLVAIKLIKCGGLVPAMDIVRVGREHGLTVTVIDPLGSAVSLNAGLAVAVTIDPHAYAHGLSAGFDVRAPFAPHVPVQRGHLMASDAPGLGVDVAWPESKELA